MLYGTNLLGKKEYPERTRTLFKSIAEPLLEEISASDRARQALVHCEKIFTSFPSPDTMYSLCSEKKFRKVLVSICARSEMLANSSHFLPASQRQSVPASTQCCENISHRSAGKRSTRMESSRGMQIGGEGTASVS